MWAGSSGETSGPAHITGRIASLSIGADDRGDWTYTLDVVVDSVPYGSIAAGKLRVRADGALARANLQPGRRIRAEVALRGDGWWIAALHGVDEMDVHFVVGGRVMEVRPGRTLGSVAVRLDIQEVRDADGRSAGMAPGDRRWFEGALGDVSKLPRVGDVAVASVGRRGEEWAIEWLAAEPRILARNSSGGLRVSRIPTL